MKRSGPHELIILLLVVTISFLYCSPRKDKVVANGRSFENFSFRKIQVYLDDSATYFHAIDTVYSHLPHAQALYEIYACKRGYFYNIKRDYAKCLLYSDSMLAVLKDLTHEPGYLYWYSKALLYKGDDLQYLKRFPESFSCYYLAREAIFETGDSCNYREYHDRLA